MAECAKFPDLTSDESKIIEVATTLNVKRAIGYGFSVFKGKFLFFF